MKRNLFAELKEGMAELAAEREGKLTLRTVDVEVPDALEVSPDEIRNFNVFKRFAPLQWFSGGRHQTSWRSASPVRPTTLNGRSP